MSLLDLITGGKSSDADEAIKRAEAAYGDVQVPTAGQLTHPELQKFVQAGVMTPAQAKAALMQGNAYDNISVNPESTEAEMSALSKLQDIAESGGMDDQAKAKLAQALEQSKIKSQGDRGYIQDQMAAKGIPTSLMGTAAEYAAAGQDAESNNLAATQAAGDAEQRALAALAESGGLAGQIHGQDYTEQANKAAAANAIKQWNAQNTTDVSKTNAGYGQQANLVNAETAQAVADKNTTTGNQRTVYNAGVPQTVFQDKAQKAAGQAGAAEKAAEVATGQGQQQAGLEAGLLGAGTTLGGDYMQSQAMKDALSAMAPMAMGDKGGKVPGTPEVAGDDRRNDKVHTMLSPGEVVIPRSIATHPQAPNLAKQFVEHVRRTQMPLKSVHKDDVRAVLDALTERRP